MFEKITSFVKEHPAVLPVVLGGGLGLLLLLRNRQSSAGVAYIPAPADAPAPAPAPATDTGLLAALQAVTASISQVQTDNRVSQQQQMDAVSRLVSTVQQSLTTIGSQVSAATPQVIVVSQPAPAPASSIFDRFKDAAPAITQPPTIDRTYSPATPEKRTPIYVAPKPVSDDVVITTETLRRRGPA